jgi:hypothetical protein
MSKGKTPLIAAAAQTPLEATRLLLENGADCEKKWCGDTAFDEVRKRNHSEVVALLKVRATVCPSLFCFYSLHPPLPPLSGSSFVPYTPVSFSSYTSIVPSSLMAV